VKTITTSIRWATVGTAAVLVALAAGCGGVDPAVAHWAKAWKRKVERPMQRAAARLAASIGPALAGSASASFALTPALNTLSNCRLPLDVGLADTPSELAKARQQTIRVCRLIYVTDKVIGGLNSLSSATANAGMARVRHGLAMLRRIGREVKRAAGPR
jgi:hypothetical protein